MCRNTFVLIKWHTFKKLTRFRTQEPSHTVFEIIFVMLIDVYMNLCIIMGGFNTLQYLEYQCTQKTI